MTINAEGNAKNTEEKRAIRWAVVGGGQISQQAFMPAIGRTESSELVALVSGDEEKRDRLAGQYGLAAYGYEQYPELLASGTIDAVYVATPVFRHREFAVPALEAGLHALVEKPLEVSVEAAQAIIDAAERGGATLMAAYRLHQEPGTVALVEAVRGGAVGEPRFFSSVFAQTIDERNHRSNNGFWGGPVADMGTYPLNEARMLFDAEPIEVSAHGVRTSDRDFPDTVAVTLVFPDERVAQFTAAYSTAYTESFTLAGSEGIITSSSCYDWGGDVAITWTTTDADGNSSEHRYDPVDQFAGQVEYFVDCVRAGSEPEPSGAEGLCDVRVLAAIEKSLESGEPVSLEPYERTWHVTNEQVRSVAPGHDPGDDEMVSVITQNP
ncbi:Gfo/Idh/MocA family oxidoreductase [Dermacoccus abyssi]|uniref:Gfo/Idh/MocA family protein n=1 Tax=Dermacoccus abyssi TaxID=322596 RepID=UPI0021A65661|nr:Gfo/Idh/MocA family oxidoreductase [Dermacoccus abyssi]MCT1986772.1 Gfo/Idh/MocA family oxidoreductase [Dermacoccus abyssi]